MRTLPVHPDLAFYRKEAKNLTREYRARHADAQERVQAHHPRFREGDTPGHRFSLHDAQLVIAREHGFPSWPKFKHQVDFRNLDFSDLEEAFKHFQLAVNTGDAEKLRTLLDHNEELASRLDEPVFAFDSPAVVHAKHNREILELLISAGADINRKSSWEPGGFGVLDENEKQADWLLAHGAKLDAYAASSLGMADDLRRLIAEDPGVVNQRFGDGQTPLHVAKTREIAQILLDAGADVSIRCLDHNSNAAQYQVNNPEVCRLLLEHGAEPDLFMACRLGDFELVKRLVTEDPAWLDAKLREGRFKSPAPGVGDIYIWKLMGLETPHRVARKHGFDEIYRWLIEQCSPQQQFTEACWRADRAEAEALLRKHPGILAQLDEAQQRTLPNAVWDKQADAVALMLDLGWDVNVPGDHASTPLDRAGIRGQARLVRLILAHGPELNTVNEFGGTPLTACLWGKINFRDPDGDYLESLRRLLEAGCLPESGDGPRDWVNVLWFAMRSGQPDTVPLLTPYCRDLNLRDDTGLTALDIALEQGADEAAAHLRDHGAQTAEELAG